MLKTKTAKIIVGWGLAITTGIGGFVLTKVAVEDNRRDAMKVRERMRNANAGDYETKRTFTG